MKLNARSYWFALQLLVMLSVPAVAQFEVSPDHFEDSPSSTRQVAHSNSGAKLKLQDLKMQDLKMQDLKMQIGEQKKLLVSYQGQLLEKSALVAKARQALGDSGSAAARNDLLRQKSELRELRESLASSIRDAQLALARLERQQQALRAARTRHPRSSSAAVLSASK